MPAVRRAAAQACSASTSLSSRAHQREQAAREVGRVHCRGDGRRRRRAARRAAAARCRRRSSARRASPSASGGSASPAPAAAAADATRSRRSLGGDLGRHGVGRSPARARPRSCTVSATSSDCATTRPAAAGPPTAARAAGAPARRPARRWGGCRARRAQGRHAIAGGGRSTENGGRRSGVLRSFAHRSCRRLRRTLDLARLTPRGACGRAAHEQETPSMSERRRQARRTAPRRARVPRVPDARARWPSQATKQLVNQRDLALAYSPGVAAACEEIVADPANAFRYTARGNLVAVVTNGTAVLGLGDIGPLAAKPVMEGKAVLFKKFAGIDVFDIEIARERPRQAGRRHRRARAHLRRHQPRGHQGAGLLLRRAQAARAHEDPGLPRRPARHRDHRRRGAAERAEGGRARTSTRSSWSPRGAGAAALACLDLLRQAGPAAREHLGHRPGRRGLRRAAPS